MYLVTFGKHYDLSTIFLMYQRKENEEGVNNSVALRPNPQFVEKELL